MLLSAKSLLWAAGTAAAATEEGIDLVLQTDTLLSAEGYFVLTWSSQAADPLVLEQAGAEDFRAAVAREVPASGNLTITGLADGRYFFRVGDGSGRWSEPIEITVRHHALPRALFFFGMGLLLFLVLCFTILTGSRRDRRLADDR